MNTKQLTEQEFSELKKICVYLFDHIKANRSVLPEDKFGEVLDSISGLESLIAKEQQNNKIRNIRQLDKVAIVLGFSLTTIYNISSVRLLTIKKYEAFCNLFTGVVSVIKIDENDKLFIEKFYILKAKLDLKFELDLENTGVLSLLKNSSFFLFERLLNSISKKVVIIDDFLDNSSSSLSVTILTAEHGMTTYEGEAFLDASYDFLNIRASQKNQPYSLPINLLLRVSKTAKSISLITGHLTGVNRRDNNVVTKSIVLKKIKDNDLAKPEELQIEDSLTKEKVGDNIYKFLNDRSRNRLSSPHSRLILNEIDFQLWHDANDRKKRQNINKSLLGNYILYYSSGVSRFTKDTLIIKENINLDIEVEYWHQPLNQFLQRWDGVLIYSPVSRAAFISLYGPRERNETSNSSPIFLILNIPIGNMDFNYLAGIVSGIRDEMDGAVGMLALAKKIHDNDNKQKIELTGHFAEKLKFPESEKVIQQKFFKNFSSVSSINPPSSIINEQNLESLSPIND